MLQATPTNLGEAVEDELGEIKVRLAYEVLPHAAQSLAIVVDLCRGAGRVESAV